MHTASLDSLRKMAVIGLCWIGIAGLLCFLISRFLLWPLTAWMPPSVQFVLGQTGYPLLQYSKRDFLPNNYILIAGDSYAYGVGEYFYDNIKKHRLAYHAGHTLHALSSRDVISIGFPHMGNIGDLALLPTTFREKIESKYGYALEEPEFVIAYFYEGNDLANNVEDMLYHHPDFQYRHNAPDNAERFQDYLAIRAQAEKNNVEASTGFLLTDFVAGVILLSDFINPTRRIYGPDTPGLTNQILQQGRATPLPDRLEAMGMFLSEEEFDMGVFVFKNSLAYLQQQYPHSKIGVIYIPSTLSSYQIASPEVSVFVHAMTRQEEVRYPATLVTETSNRTCSAIYNATTSLGAGFIDARKRFRHLGKQTQLHGSKDWNHPSQAGYIALGEVAHTLFLQLINEQPPQSCETL